MVLNKVEHLNTGPGGYSGSQMTRDDRMGAKIKSQKNPHAEFPSPKNFQKAKQVWLYFITLSHPENTSQIFPPQKLLIYVEK